MEFHTARKIGMIDRMVKIEDRPGEYITYEMRVRFVYFLKSKTSLEYVDLLDHVLHSLNGILRSLYDPSKVGKGKYSRQHWFEFAQKRKGDLQMLLAHDFTSDDPLPEIELVLS
jgi:hypothetical protein